MISKTSSVGTGFTGSIFKQAGKITHQYSASRFVDAFEQSLHYFLTIPV